MNNEMKEENKIVILTFFSIPQYFLLLYMNVVFLLNSS